MSPLREPQVAGFALDTLTSPRLGCLDPERFPVSVPKSATFPLLSRCPSLRVDLLDRTPRTGDYLSHESPRIAEIPVSEFRFADLLGARVPLLESRSSPRITKVSPEVLRLGEIPVVSEVVVAIATPETVDGTGILEDLPRVSADLFQPLGHSRLGGKKYQQRPEQEPKQQRFPFAPPENDGTPGYKRSYTERRCQDGTMQREGLSVWDLILPLLQPPLTGIPKQDALILPAELKPHQPEGVKFLASQTGALLGDDVQTGKTIQAIVAMKVLFQCGKIKSALVVAPISVLKHWQDRIQQWAPELWQGLNVVRSPDKNERQNRWTMPAFVHLTNYETVRGDVDLICQQHGEDGYGLIIADEIQKIKNADTGVAKAVKQLGKRAAYRWGLSATPLEGSINDLVSIFEFLRPGLLQRGRETEASVIPKFTPHFLRRKAQDISKSFKEPQFDEYRVEMEGRQLEAYDDLFRDSAAELRRLGEKVTVAHALAKLQALKQLCNVHLASGQSAKVEFLKDWLEEVVARENKALVFSQYREFGKDFLEKQLGQFGCVNYGGTDAEKETAVQDFVNNPEKRVFIAHPATAGIGLPDLKVANYVFHFDHWWNPALEEQANGRILGFGQKKDVFIAHVWVENSIEQRIETILEEKRRLFGRVIDAQTSVDGTGLSIEEVFRLFDMETPVHLRGAAKADHTATRAASGFADLNPREMEFLVERLYRAMGYCARTTPQSRDGGVDVVALRDTASGREKLAIQCKHQTGTVGREVLQKLLGVIAADPSYSAGVVVTSADFSRDAREFGQQNGRLQLIDGNVLQRLLVQYHVPITEPK